MTDGAVVEQRVVSVFNSDDDLTNFLAGLRAKYASLYPQFSEAEHGAEDANGALPSFAPDAAAPSDISTGAFATSGPPASTFEQQISQLRSSLQSLQHILPPRTSTTANLLDSFIAVSGDRTFSSESNAAAASVMLRKLPDQDGANRDSRVTAAAASAGTSSPSQAAAPASHVSIHGNPLDCGPAPPLPLARGSTFSTELVDRTAVAVETQTQSSTVVFTQSAAPSENDAPAASQDPGRNIVSAHIVPSGENDHAPSDAAFVELAAGYTRRTLQPPSSEASASSFDGHVRPGFPPAALSAHDRQGAGRAGGELTFGGALPPAHEAIQAWNANQPGGAWECAAQVAARETGLEAPALGPPVAAQLTLCPPHEQQQHGTVLGGAGGATHLFGLQPPEQQQLGLDVSGFANEDRHSGSPAAVTWCPHRGHSPSSGRRRAWQLVGLGAAIAGSCSPRQDPHVRAHQFSDCADTAAPNAAGVPGAAVTDNGVINDVCEVRAPTYVLAAVGAGFGAAEDASDRPAGSPHSDFDRAGVATSDAADPGPLATHESSAGWDSVDDGTPADGEAVPVVDVEQECRQPSVCCDGLQASHAPLSRRGGSSSTAATGDGFWGIGGRYDGDRAVTQQSPGSVEDVGDFECCQRRGGTRRDDANSREPQHFALRDQHASGDLSAPLLQGQQGSPRLQQQQQQCYGNIGHLLNNPSASGPELLQSVQNASTGQEPREQPQEGSGLLEEAAGNEFGFGEATAQFQAAVGGVQRPRRRWGSPAPQLHHQQQQQSLTCSLPEFISLTAAAKVSSTGHRNGASWLSNAGGAVTVEWPTSPSGSFDVRSLVAFGDDGNAANLLDDGIKPALNLMVRMGADPGGPVGDRSVDPEPAPAARELTVPAKDAAAFGDVNGLSSASERGVEIGGRSAAHGAPQQKQEHRFYNPGPHRPLRLLPPRQQSLPAATATAAPSRSPGLAFPNQSAALVVPAPQIEQPLTQQTSVDLRQPMDVPGGPATTSPPSNDEVLCGSPPEQPPPPLQQQPLANVWREDPAMDCSSVPEPEDCPAATMPGRSPARSPLTALAAQKASLSACSTGITASRGGIAFSISAHPAPSETDAAPRQQQLWASGALNQAATDATGALEGVNTLIRTAALLAPAPRTASPGPGAIPGPMEWTRLNKQLREAGFSGLVLAQVDAGATMSMDSQAAGSAELSPEPASLYRCLSSVLDQYVRRNRLVAELLAATEESGRVAEQQEAAVRELKREANAARIAAEKSRRELAEMSSQQIPKVEARHAVQLGRLRSEAAKLKEALRESELDVSAKAEEIRSLRATIAGLQSATSHSSDVEGAVLRQRVAQLEGLLRNRDKEVEKLKSIKEAEVGQAADGQANALDRAYEAEAAARRLETELTAAKTRIGHLEQGLRQRERDVASMREDLQQIKACEAAATLVAQERSTAAEETSRRAEAEAVALRSKLKELEGFVRYARQELEKQRSEAEALRSSAYEEVYRMEDECRTLSAELAASRTRVTQLEHVVRAKERDMARVKDEKEAAKAAERERARVAEEVAVKLEAELTASKVRLTQAEGAVRTRERELARLADLLRQTQGAEVEAWLKQSKLEEGSRKLENDFTSLRLRVLQLEATLKGRDKDCDKLGRTVEALRGEVHELTSKLAKSEEVTRKGEADLATCRGKVLNLEGQVRVKEREQERLVRVVEGLKAGDAEVASRQAALEEAARRLDGQLTAARSRVAALEGVVRARDAAVERLNRQLEALKTADFERTAQVLKSEEAARQQDTEAASLRQRILHLEGQLRAKERDLERSARQVDAGEVTAGRQRTAQLSEALRARERDVAALTRALEAHRAAEHEANAVAGRTEEAARKLDGEAVELRQRLVQAEGQLRTREREMERQARALEAALTAAAESATRQGEAEATARRLEADAAGLRQRLAQAEGAVRAREKELERVEKLADQASGAEAAAEAKLRTAEATVTQRDGELSSLRLRISQLEAAARGHSKEMDRLTRVMDQSKVAEVDAAMRAQRSDESARQVAAELASARSRLAKVEASLAAREQDAQRVQRLLAAAEAQAATQVSRSDDFIRKVTSDLATMRQQAGQLAHIIRARDRQLATLRGALEAAQAAEAKAAEQRRQSEEALRKVESELAAERQRAVQLEGQVKSRDREMEKLNRQLDADRDQSGNAATAAGRETSTLKDAAARSEAALCTARARVTQLESELLAKERQLEGLQRLVGSSRAGDAEAAAAAEERACRAEEAARRLDVELAAVRQRYAHLEHTYRSRETTLEKLRAALANKVTQEERRVARDKAAYQRIPQQQQQRAAGAMAAAARELRPVEIVGLYETRRETAEQELAAYCAEVRSLADQLREAQNHIAIKDRTGAWRTPTELAEMQARIILLERRSADLQRELDRSRLEAAEAARAAERRLAEAEHRVTQLKEDNEALVHELDSRPTIQDNRVLKREVEILEKRVLQLKGSTATSGAGAGAEGGETALSIAAAAKGRKADTMLTTSQRIARDRNLHHLGLRTLEDWPKDVLVDLVQDVCIELDIRDATTLPAAVRKTLRVVGAVPRMEAFIGAVCERVYIKGAPFVPPHIDGTTDPSRVLEVLELWLGLLQEAAQLRGAMRAIVEALAARAEGMAAPIHGPADVVVSVRQLIEAEAAALTARESLAAASHHLKTEPEQLLSRLVSHFMRLFDCPSLEGVVPAVNRLYVTLNEQRNFIRALATALDLPADAGASACMARVWEIVKADDRNGGPAAQPNTVGRSARMAQPDADVSSERCAVPIGVDASAALENLMMVFGVRNATAAVDAAEKMVARLKRLDEVLPRYQRLASQLFETLRVTALEEILPALQVALHR
ncbi:hypothetical protein VOLCADRAFT_117327 [Volvox carteri f. nagariensis]|uniref:Centrosomal protein of 70 kDa n=1 Tax=Volvox carteri f. nagariensis TaxID=3068 RepID=D8TTF4_VOLCA|nr:uncharacterized protein VOLCADRAFT_117327 [Volvox carteri f. nagariensis]EFJ49191.1 hypothetical protein VOLCADRAFT_117327 [Volvox carteri f. nagariensis]|eukprot:XP_002949639.1 hypothetical protein VOLCADRAFT_117327 [Volvox carteri f. nagariensis]